MDSRQHADAECQTEVITSGGATPFDGDVHRHRESQLVETISADLLSMNANLLRQCFGDEAELPQAGRNNSPLEVLFSVDHCSQAPISIRADEVANANADDGDDVYSPIPCPPHSQEEVSNTPTLLSSRNAPEEYLDLAASAEVAYETYSNRFREGVWSCCASRCFQALVSTTSNSLKRFLSQVIEINKSANEMLKRRDECTTEQGTNRAQVRQIEKEYQQLCVSVFPFLTGRETRKGISGRICIASIQGVLNISLNGLYYVKQRSRTGSVPSSIERLSVVDESCSRQRQHRRVGSRQGYPDLMRLTHDDYKCECLISCFAGMSMQYLEKIYADFSALSRGPQPREKENKFLLTIMFSPMLNSAIPTCNKALSDLLTISTDLVASVRRVITQMCSDPTLLERPFREHGMKVFRRQHHPMNRLPDALRAKVVTNLQLIMRADPGATSGRVSYRPYSPEINTYDKLCSVLAKRIDTDDESEVSISPKSMARMVEEFLESRNGRLTMSRKYHNLCPHCKAMELAILNLDFECKDLEARISANDTHGPRNLADANEQNSTAGHSRATSSGPWQGSQLSSHDATVATGRISNAATNGGEAALEEQASMNSGDVHEAEDTNATLERKRFQLEETSAEYDKHNARDIKIRNLVKSICGFFSNTHDGDNAEVAMEFGLHFVPQWASLSRRGIVTHQDDMSKIDIPYFFRQSMAELARYRFDINAHVNALTNSATVFSHEQGFGSKNASSIFEGVLLDHLLSCKGEAIKGIVSDCAAVGRNMVTSVALCQYFVDQGLCSVCIVVFLENCHGKWIADSLFGQARTKLMRTTVISVDGLLDVFESIQRSNGGKVRGFALNPLSCVDFSKVLDTLGYEISPHKDLCWEERNIHCVASCSSRGKEELPDGLVDIIGELLPDDEGMVRCSFEPPGAYIREHSGRVGRKPFSERPIDVPAAKLSTIRNSNVTTGHPLNSVITGTPLAISANQPFASKGPCVVSTATAAAVGHNGWNFRKKRGAAELNMTSSVLVKHAWPPDFGDISSSGPTKVAPQSWIARRTVQNLAKETGLTLARYPPMNLVNALCKKGPRCSIGMIETATYEDPPFPLIEGTSAFYSMQRFNAFVRARQGEINNLNVLDMLRFVYAGMGNRSPHCDEYLQNPVTIPSESAVNKYKRILQISKERRKGHPKAIRTTRQFFKKDTDVIRRVDEIMSGKESSDDRSRTDIFRELFDALEEDPEAFRKYKNMVSEDEKRFAEEMKVFRLWQRDYDEQAGL